jgi:hypothetical protein
MKAHYVELFQFHVRHRSGGGTAQSVLLNASLMFYRLQQVTLLLHQQPKVDVVIAGNA